MVEAFLGSTISRKGCEAAIMTDVKGWFSLLNEAVLYCK